MNDKSVANRKTHKELKDVVDNWDFKTINDTSYKHQNPVDWYVEAIEQFVTILLLDTNEAFEKIDMKLKRVTLIATISKMAQNPNDPVYTRDYKDKNFVNTLDEYYHDALVVFLLGDQFLVIPKRWERSSTYKTKKELDKALKQAFGKIKNKLVEES